MNELPFAATTPISVAQIGLRARNAENLASFYREVIGLEELSRDKSSIRLGVGDRELMEIEADPSAQPEDPRSAGLFHTAFLLPARADLGRWIRHAIAKNIAIDGASDHLVSEALYLNDPEGNGIEIYVDRPRESWNWHGSRVDMATERLDIASVIASVPEGAPEWKGAPENSVVGHVHLRVGDPAEAEAWWNSEFGFDTVQKYGEQAVFLSSGGYHHHIGANSWRSARAGRREPGHTGLTFVEMRSAIARTDETREDPWGTIIRTVADKA
ncbi:VOC family protein [Pseudaminobacter sp. NGMCC 1.201702]|uniref:VOC family protein n=1 Tax=Pseudaminobacter sp. NGMCC 1.201702 TaxID=3391825 RepID=UPI0039EEA753